MRISSLFIFIEKVTYFREMIRTDKFYVRGNIVEFEEDIVTEFKGHRTISIENRKSANSWDKNADPGKPVKTRQQWSKYLCGMLNSGRGGVYVSRIEAM